MSITKCQLLFLIIFPGIQTNMEQLLRDFFQVLTKENKTLQVLQ